MNNHLKSFVILFSVTCFFLLLASSGLLMAQELPKSLNLDLNVPPPKEVKEEPSDPILEKYHEVMNEISISQEAVEVVEHIKDVITELEDISMDVCITEIKGQRDDEVSLKLGVSVEERLARVEFFEPSALRGMIIVADQEKMETRMFQPVRNKITVQALEDVSKEALSALSVSQITTYFDFTQYEVIVLETTEQDGVYEYLLEVDALDGEMWHVWVNSDTWVPHAIAVFEAEILIGKMTFTNVVLNPELTREKLMELPKVKEERI